MYEGYWHLSGNPFENWGEDHFYYPSEVHETALLQAQYAVENRRAAVAICGDCGMGKSLVADRLALCLSEAEAPIARVVFPHLSGEQLLGYIADELTGQCGPPDEPPRMTLRRLTDFLGDNIEQRRHAVLIVDEAHLLSGPDQLETLRLLLNLKHDRSRGEAAMTLLLVGQTTLLTNIERFRALDDRVATKCLLNRFTADQTACYIAHRMAKVGGLSEAVFSDEAIETLHLRAMGIPRRINRLADLALMVGFAEEAARVEARHVEGVHQELVAAA